MYKTVKVILTVMKQHSEIKAHRNIILKLQQDLNPSGCLCFARTKLIFAIASAHISVCYFSCVLGDGVGKRPWERRCLRQAVGTFDVCLAWLKVCSTDIVRPHVAQLMIDTTVDQFCLCKQKYGLVQIDLIFATYAHDDNNIPQKPMDYCPVHLLL